MLIDGQAMRTLWVDEPLGAVFIINQILLPHDFRIERLESLVDAATAIRDMQVRGAPLIGVTAAYGVALAMRADSTDVGLKQAVDVLGATRPTAVNLHWALSRCFTALAPLPAPARLEVAYALAAEMAEEDVRLNSAIGDHGVALLRDLAARKNGRLNILTHCNAGWLATIDWGTATAPIYKAFAKGIDLHVWVDETRPRNQGASLTAFELGHQGVPHTIIVDNAGGHLMQHGEVDCVIVGTDRTTAAGDVCNKIGTYLKALAAQDNNVPFYVAAPSPSIDFSLENGVRDIPIECRSAREITHMSGHDGAGVAEVRITPAGSPAHNPAFDVTPARLVTGLITERGVVAANRQALAALFPERVISG